MKKTIIANWKMKLGQKESLDLAKKIKNGLCKKEARVYDRFIGVQDRWKKNLNVVLCPSYTALSEIHKILLNSGMNLGSQDIFWEEKGAYTGEVSISSLKELGVSHNIIGHSERRKNLNETDEIIKKKVELSLEKEFIPILCIGETLEERISGEKDYIIAKQVLKILEGLKISKNQNLIIAYEPIWAIGTGQPVDPNEAQMSIKFIKTSLLDIFQQKFIDNNITLVYGGSITSKDAKNFLSQPDIQGLLIGGASLDAEEFLKIMENSCKVSEEKPNN